MPNRVIRDGWVESEKVDQLSAEGERFFIRLCLRADDYGRYHGNASLLRSNLFPLKDTIDTADIVRWVKETHAAGLVIPYESEGKLYLEIQRFDQRTRALTSKFPARGGEQTTFDRQLTVISQANGSHMRTEAETETKTESNAETESVKRLADANPASEEEWLAGLAANEAFQGIDVPREFQKMKVWCAEHKKEATRRRFVNWLNRCDKPLTAGRKRENAGW